MAHDMTEWDQRRALYGRGLPAWHLFGTVLAGLFGRAEAEKAIGYPVKKVELTLPGTDIPIPGRYMTVNDDIAPEDPNRVLGVVGERYEVLQGTCLLDLGDALMTEANGAIYDTAFTMRGGALAVAVVKLPEVMRVLDDSLQEFLLLATSHDGSMPVRAFLTPVRAVCGNTLRAALKGAKGVNQITVRHTSGGHGAIKEAQRLLRAGHEHFGALAEAFNFLATTPVDRKGVKRYLETLVPVGQLDSEKSKTRARNVRRAVESLFDGKGLGANQQAAAGTAYGLYNAATEYADWTRGIANTGRPFADSAVESVLFGTGADFKQKALNAALELAGASA